MVIRKFRPGEEKELYALFYNTIHNVNIKDYGRGQINAWAPSDIETNAIIQKFRKIDPFVVIKEGQIVAYADVQPDGYIDHFFCHHDHQGQGIGRTLFTVLEQNARQYGAVEMHSNVSITARPFFEAMGFTVEKEQVIHVKDQQLKNYRMVRTDKPSEC